MRSSFWPNLIPFFILVLCIFSLTAWHPRASDKNSKTVRENAFFSHIHFRQFDEKGELSNQFYAEKLSLLSDKRAIFSKPNFVMATTDHSPWIATSRSGISYDNGKKIVLMGSVHLIQAPTPTSSKTDITANLLWLFPRKNIATTPEFIQIEQPGTSIKGQGLFADLKKNYFSLKSQTSGFYTPAPNEEPYQFQSHSMHYDRKKHMTVYIKDVNITKASEKIQGDIVTVHTGPKNEIQNLVALGNPAHYQSIPKNKPEPLDAFAQSIQLNSKQNIAILKKNAKVTQGKDTLMGNYVWYDTKRGIAKTKPTTVGDKTVINLEPDTKTK
jgi:lipopolysaccharide export system protein LptC